MTISSDILFLCAFAGIVLITLFVVGYTGLKLAKGHHGTDVRVVWYLFSLAVVVTWIAAAWASSCGAIDSQGGFQGEVGASLHALLKYMLDLDTDLKIFSALLAITLLPQLVSYLLSGPFGCASAPIFVGKAIQFFIWSIVKSFVVAAGIILTIGLYGYFRDWNGWSVKGMASMLGMSSFLLMLSFAMLFLLRDFYADLAKPAKNRFPKLQRIVGRLQAAMTRNQS